MTPLGEARFLKDPPPDTLTGAIWHSPFLTVSRDGALIRLPDGTALHHDRREAGLRCRLPPGRSMDDLRPLVQHTLFAILAWQDGLVPLAMPGLLFDQEVMLLAQADAALSAEILVAQIARLSGAEVTDSMVALAPEGGIAARISGASLGVPAILLPDGLRDCVAPPAVPGSARIRLALPAAAAGERQGPVTIIAGTSSAEGSGPALRALDHAASESWLRKQLVLEDLALALHGEAELARMIARLARRLEPVLIASGTPDGLPDLLCNAFAAREAR